MEIKIYQFGNIKIDQYEQLSEHYLTLARQKLKSVKLQRVKLPDKNSGQKQLAVEILENHSLSKSNTFVLAEWGRGYSTKEFIDLVKGKYNYGESINFVVGNAHGWERLKGDGIRYISLSAMTYNHELALLMLSEQVYRSIDAITGGNYAKD